MAQQKRRLLLNLHVTEEGLLAVDLPPGIPPGAIQVSAYVEMEGNDAEVDLEAAGDMTWTAEERATLLELAQPDPQPIGDILKSSAIGSWQDWDKGDPAEWVRTKRMRGRADR